MSMADFGSFMGGISQGQQAAAAQKERAQYLAMLQQRQRAADQDKSDTSEAQARADFAEFNSDTDAPLATDPFGGRKAPGGGAGPMPGQPQPPMPGQPSQPMMQPGAGPMPGAPGGAPQVQQRPPMAGNAPPMPQQPRPAPPNAGMQPQPGQMPPQQRPQGPPGGMPPQGQQPPQGAPQQPAPQGPPKTPEELMQRMGELQEKMQQPMAQKILSDPGVVAAHKATDSFVAQMRKDGVGFGPGDRKPNGVEMKELQLLHSRTELAATKAAKDVTDNEKEQVSLGGHMASLLNARDALKARGEQFQQAEAGRNNRAAARGGAGAGGGAGGPVDQDRVNYFLQYYKQNGQMPARTKVGDPDMAAAQRIIGGDPSATATGVANRGASKADTASEGKITALADRMDASLGTFDKNMDMAVKNAEQYGVKGNQPINKIRNSLKGQMGDGLQTAFEDAVRTVQGEYAKLLTASTSAGGSNVEALKRASDSISTNMSIDQLKAAQRTLHQDGKNTVSELRRVGKEADQRVRSRGDAAPGKSPPLSKSALMSQFAAVKASDPSATLDDFKAHIKEQGGSFDE